ncbi:MAG: putative zinc-binding peptidase [Pseudomonadota bacterium]|nr:MAG: putative zinc-binding peptidase [Pseudomonadota bacterium]
MRSFQCTCGNTVYFENSQCVVCQRALGFLPGRQVMSAIEPNADGTHRALADGMNYRQCQHYAKENVCNWMVAPDDPNAYCQACRLNQMIPNLSEPRNRVLWMRIERAKRRLLYTLYSLGLPVIGRDADPVNGLAFEFLADMTDGSEFTDISGAQRVLTGHRGGLITINIEEADPSSRESVREQMGEQYRTLLGHFRHEVAHLYWDRLVRGAHWHEPFRELFGDERTDYDVALSAYYAQGARADWQESFVSAYATAHPWEDWAETWAHYLHMVDTLDTAHDFGFALQGAAVRAPEAAFAHAAAQTTRVGFDELLADWVRLTLALNALNRSMGLRDAYPFAHSPHTVEKLRFVHRVIMGVAA